MDPLDAIAAASSTFVDVLDQVHTDQLARPTPCADWDVQGLLDHVVVGSRMAVALLDGASQEEANALRGQTFGDEVVDRCREAVAGQLDRVLVVSDWDVVVHHTVGDVPASRLLEFRTDDLTLHSWDLASALGVDVEIADDLLEAVFAHLEPMTPFIGEIGVYGSGPSGSVAADAPLQVRLLDLSGRRP